jgi:hypothetical protein
MWKGQLILLAENCRSRRLGATGSVWLLLVVTLKRLAAFARHPLAFISFATRFLPTFSPSASNRFAMRMAPARAFSLSQARLITWVKRLFSCDHHEPGFFGEVCRPPLFLKAFSSDKRLFSRRSHYAPIPFADRRKKS